MSKPEMTYAELVRQDSQARVQRMWLELKREHRLQGCPMDRGYAGCPVCGKP